MLFLIEDNGYAISVPVEAQTAGGNISKLAANFPHFLIEECDGTDPLESYAALGRAVAHCRARRGPALVHAHVIRPYSHSLSDDEKLYKTSRGARRRGAGATRCRSLGCSWCAKEFSTKARWRRSRRTWIARFWRRRIARSQPSRRRRIPFTRTSIRRTSIRRGRSLRSRRNSPGQAAAGRSPRRRRWSKSFPRRWRTKWPATIALWCSAKMWRTARAKRICRS